MNFLEDYRLGVVFPRFWGDLRTHIDQRMMRNVNKSAPFDLATAVRISLQFAEGMDWLHRRDIIHRDLKASTILINTDCCTEEAFQCFVADFECSVGVVGTTSWRAPETLQASKATMFSNYADIYSYGMTCYEVLTGKLPFEGLSEREGTTTVLLGCRPSLPFCLDSQLKRLIECCWHQDPEQRPSFTFICLELKTISTEHKKQKRRLSPKHELERAVAYNQIHAPGST